MNPDEVIEKLNEMGVSISRKTLYNYEQWGLIPKAIFRNSRTTIYSPETVAEAYASYRLLHDKELNKPLRLSLEAVAHERKNGLIIESDPREMERFYNRLGTFLKSKQNGMVIGHLYVEEWLKFKAEAEVWPVPPDTKIELIYLISADGSSITKTINTNDREGITVKFEEFM